MAKIDFNSMQDDSVISGSTGNQGNDVGFFTLKNDNDEAIVRFMCDSTDDFEILTVHEISVGGKFRKVNCIRDPREPLDNCPLCKNGTKINQRFFIKMIQYEQVPDQATGITKVVAKPVIWERATSYAKTLKSYLDNYGPLSDVICKVIRHGKAGDMQTTYEIVPNLSKIVFKDEIYVKDPQIFGTFQSLGTIVMDKSADDINQFLVTGSFPVNQNNTQANNANAEVTPRTATPAAAPQINIPQPNVAPTAYAQPTPMQTAPQAPVAANPTPAPMTATPAFNPSPAPQFGAAPAAPANNGWGAPAGGGFARPTRQY